MTDREFDIIIFGASGFTGRYVMEELANSERSSSLKWAVAGRNIQKLKKSIEIVQGYLVNVSDITRTTIIKADVKNPCSISEMCKRTKLILNCVGPYTFYGEVVVSACIENGTHHVDLSVEIQYLETIQAKYFKAAREKGVYIVEACGFASIPTDYGISLLKRKFHGDLNAVEAFIELDQGPEGRSTNIGTFLSIIHNIKDALNSKKYGNLLKEKVFRKELVKSNFPLYMRFPLIFYSCEVKGWCCWFAGHDDRIIKRSQMFRYEYLNDRPIQFNEYFRMPSLIIALCHLLCGVLVGSLSLFSSGRHLISKYVDFFTAGIFSSNGPSRKQVLEGTTTFHLYGSGWEDKLAIPTDQQKTEPKKQIKLTINGPEAAYSLTSMCMVQAGLTIIQEKHKLPLEGGVLTPGVAFENTTLRERLERRGMTFEFEHISEVFHYEKPFYMRVLHIIFKPILNIPIFKQLFSE